MGFELSAFKQLLTESGIVDDACYETLFVQADIFDKACMTVAISKLIGFAIILGSLILKLPQIIKIVSARSTKGLAASMYMMESIGFCIVAAFAVHEKMPFSAFGENLFMFVQNSIILLLIWAYGERSTVHLLGFSIGLGSLVYALLGGFNGIITAARLQLMRRSCILLFGGSKLPQIITNFKNGSTGQLSMITQGLQLAGNLARVGTTLHDPGAFNWIVLFDFIFGTVLNATLALQIVWYWNSSSKVTKSSERPRPNTRSRRKVE